MIRVPIVKRFVACLVLAAGFSPPVASAAPWSVPAEGFSAARPAEPRPATGWPGPRDLRNPSLADLRGPLSGEIRLFPAALAAGGVETRAECERRAEQFHRTCQVLREEVGQVADIRQRCDRILRWLHEQVLTGEYRASCSQLSNTLDHGDFNCVTATILYQELAAACGLDARAITADSHMIAVVHGPVPLYIETTCADWRAVPLAGSPELTKKIVRHGRELTAAQLVGKVYYNAGVARLEAGEFAAAVELLQAASQLDRGDLAARQNLQAAYNNWALAECDRGEYRRAVALLEKGAAMDAEYQPLQVNQQHIHQQWVRSLCAAGDFASAVRLLDELRRRSDASWIERTRAAVIEAWQQHAARHGSREAHLPPAGL